MEIKIFGPIDTSIPGVLEQTVNRYLGKIEDDERIVDIQMSIDAEGNGYVMVVTK